MTSPDDRPIPYAPGSGHTPTPAYPATAAPPRKRHPVLGLVVIAALLACVAGVIGVAASGGDSHKATPAAATRAAALPVDACGGGVCATTAPTPEATLPGGLLTAADITLKLKITEQKCFGSAGCNVTYKVQAGWPSILVGDGETYEVTYEVSGVEDGPAINTLTIVDDTHYQSDDSEFAQTTRRVKTLKVKVTDVEVQ